MTAEVETLPIVFYEETETDMNKDSNKSTRIYVTGETVQEAYEIFKKLKKEVQL